MAAVYGTLEGGRELVLTFDDGPHPVHTPRLLDVLKREGLSAMFFVLGTRVAAKGGQAIVRRAFEEGHRIGNHTYHHPDLRKLPEAGIRDEIKRTEALIGEFLTPHKLFRPPFGAHNALVDRVVRELGYHSVLWSVDTEDWRPDRKPAKWIAPSLQSIQRRGHSTLLCHDIHASTVANFAAFVQAARQIPRIRFVQYA